jgi:hypothetical protein
MIFLTEVLGVQLFIYRERAQSVRNAASKLSTLLLLTLFNYHRNEEG